MSIEAITWALFKAPKMPAQVVAVLFILANHASPDGTSSYPSQATLARAARKSDRAVRNDLKTLLDLGLIVVSPNQGPAAHIRADVRPIVYDLSIHLQGTDTPGTVLPGEMRATGSTVPGGSSVPPGSTGSSDRKHSSDKPSTKPKKKASPSSGTSRQRDASATKREAPPDPEAAARQELAKKIVEWWWERLAIKPAGGTRAYFASIRVVEQLLAVGHEAKDIAASARAAGPPLTVPRMEIELGKVQRAANGAITSPSRPSTTDQRVADARALGRQLATELNGGAA